tara:strand:- start:42 stop:512 length:471 start_codon:yes stop_codon:yes gene_type:complete
MEIFKDVKGTDGVYQISDLGRVKSLKYGKEKIINGSMGKVYKSVRIQGKRKCIHQLVAEAFLNHVPCGYSIVVDHIDGDSLNNRLDNLQLLSHRDNIAKGFKSKGGTSKHVGVTWGKHINKWIARIEINGKRKRLGSFTDELEASEAYQTELKRIT